MNHSSALLGLFCLLVQLGGCSSATAYRQKWNENEGLRELNGLQGAVSGKSLAGVEAMSFNELRACAMKMRTIRDALDKISTESRRLDDTLDQLDSENLNLDLRREKIDRTRVSDVKNFNADLERYYAEIRRYNSDIEKYHQAADKVHRSQNEFNLSCANRPFYEKDLLNLTAELYVLVSDGIEDFDLPVFTRKNSTPRVTSNGSGIRIGY